MTNEVTNSPRPRLLDLIKIQLRIGSFGFGGPLAAIALMREEFVVEKKLVSPQKFLESLAFVKILPGPVSSLMAILMGQELAGFWGGLCSGVSFILPAFLMMLAIANFESYLLAGPLGSWGFSLSPLMGVILGMIVCTCYKLFREALDHSRAIGKSQVVFSYFVFLLAGVLVYLRLPELLILLGCGVLGLFKARYSSTDKLHSVALAPLFMIFFWSSFSVFGTGYMILPVLQKILVEDNAWLTAEQFLKSVTYGNLTPGPITIASTYMGYQLSGNAGAILATLGIFVPPFMIILFFGPYLKKLFRSSWAKGFVDGIIPAVSSSVLLSLLPLGRQLTWGGWEMIGFGVGLVLSLRKWPALRVLALGLLLSVLNRFVVLPSL